MSGLLHHHVGCRRYCCILNFMQVTNTLSLGLVAKRR